MKATICNFINFFLIINELLSLLYLIKTPIFFIYKAIKTIVIGKNKNLIFAVF